jgi:hypothetical protein
VEFDLRDFHIILWSTLSFVRIVAGKAVILLRFKRKWNYIYRTFTITVHIYDIVGIKNALIDSLYYVAQCIICHLVWINLSLRTVKCTLGTAENKLVTVVTGIKLYNIAGCI